MSNSLTVLDNKPLTAQEVGANKALIQRVMAAVMKKDVHYGIIPGTKKPSLYKPGSEAILSTFRIAIMPEIQDLSTGDEIRYRVLAKGVLPDGTVVGCGLGECSTNEEKYKWRGAVCDEEFDDTPENRRRLKYGSKWNDRTRKKEMSKIKQVRTEPADLANTVLKMAKKRAQIDLTLTATGASDVFDQDIEDLPAEYVEQRVATADTTREPTITDSQAADLGALADDVGADLPKFLTYMKVKFIADIPASQYSTAVAALEAKRGK
mgnify:CR=1 FL=1